MAVRSKSGRTQTWFVAIGALVGLALGIPVSVTTEVPFAPEVGALLGALVGWFSRALRQRSVPR